MKNFNPTNFKKDTQILFNTRTKSLALSKENIDRTNPISF
jgi:hypothetical protein